MLLFHVLWLLCDKLYWFLRQCYIIYQFSKVLLCLFLTLLLNYYLSRFSISICVGVWIHYLDNERDQVVFAFAHVAIRCSHYLFFVHFVTGSQNADWVVRAGVVAVCSGLCVKWIQSGCTWSEGRRVRLHLQVNIIYHWNEGDASFS